MTFDPTQVRADAGTADGGQWVSAAAAKKAAASSKKKTPTTGKTVSSKGSSKAASIKLGPARDAAAAKIQQDPAAQQMYSQLMGMQPAARSAYLKKLPPDQLEKLTAIAYSSHTADPAVVQARVAVANEMTKRGLDIKQHGALGGGMTTAKSTPAATPAKKVAVQWAAKRATPKAAPPKAAPPKASAPSPAAVTARPTSQGRGGFSARAQ